MIKHRTTSVEAKRGIAPWTYNRAQQDGRTAWHTNKPFLERTVSRGNKIGYVEKQSSQHSVKENEEGN